MVLQLDFASLHDEFNSRTNERMLNTVHEETTDIAAKQFIERLKEPTCAVPKYLKRFDLYNKPVHVYD